MNRKPGDERDKRVPQHHDELKPPCCWQPPIQEECRRLPKLRIAKSSWRNEQHKSINGDDPDGIDDDGDCREADHAGRRGARKSRKLYHRLREIGVVIACTFQWLYRNPHKADVRNLASTNTSKLNPQTRQLRHPCTDCEKQSSSA